MRVSHLSISGNFELRPLGLILVVLLGAGSGARAQEWIEIDAWRMGLHLGHPKPASNRIVNPHHTIAIFGDETLLKRKETELTFVSRSSARGEERVAGRPGRDYQGQPTIEFRVPILEVGTYGVYLRSGGDKKLNLLGEVSIPAFRCYFNQPGDPRQARKLEEVVLSLSLQAVMVAYIDRARETLDIAMSDFDHPAFVDAVTRAHKRGIRVRFVTDARAVNDEPKARAQFDRAGVPWITNGRSLDDPSYMHHKFMVVDKLVVLVGHAKGARSHIRINQSFVSIIAPEVAKIYESELDEMWGSSQVDRRFSTAKKTRNHYFCMVQDLHKKVRVDIGFSPSKKPTFSPLTRPLNVILATLIDNATSDIGFMASGFGDIDVGNVIRRGVVQKGIRFYGVFGEPDWSLKYNPLVEQLRGLGEKPWPRPHDVVGSHETDAELKWMNVHNRAMVIDVLGKKTNPVVCFSSGAWRLGRLRSDDSMVCIHDRGVAEQFLQHLGGTRLRARKPLPFRGETRPELRWADGTFLLPAKIVVSLLGGQVRKGLKGGVVISLAGINLTWGDVSTLNISGARVTMSKPEGDDIFLPISDLALLGIGLAEDRQGQVVCQSKLGATIPLLCDSKVEAAAKEFLNLRPGERIAQEVIRLRFSDVVNVSPVAKTHLKSGLIRVKDRPHLFTVAEGDEPILVAPQVLLSLMEALHARLSVLPGAQPVTIVDGTGALGNHARGLANRWWKPLRGMGLVVNMPPFTDGALGTAGAGAFVQELVHQRARRIDLSPQHLGGMDALDFLRSGDGEAWSQFRRPGLYSTHDKRNVVSVTKKKNRYVEFSQSVRDFRKSMIGDHQGPVSKRTTPKVQPVKAGFGRLALTLFPVGGAVYFDQEFAGILSSGDSCAWDLPIGYHEVVISRSGYHDQVLNLLVESSTSRSFLVHLTPLKRLSWSNWHSRKIRPGMGVRGQITMAAPKVEDLLKKLGVEDNIAAPSEARGVRVALEKVGARPIKVDLYSHGARLNAYVIDDLGKIVFRDEDESYRSAIFVRPQPGRRYTLLLTFGALSKVEVHDLVRYSLYFEPTSAQ